MSAVPEPVTFRANTGVPCRRLERPTIDPAVTENGNVSANVDGPSGGNVAVPPTANPVPLKNKLGYEMPFTVPEPLPISPPQCISIGWIPARHGEHTVVPPSKKTPARENMSPSNRNRAAEANPGATALIAPDVIDYRSPAT